MYYASALVRCRQLLRYKKIRRCYGGKIQESVTSNITYCHFTMGKRKALQISSKPNQDLCNFLMELASYERNVGKNIYKANAYRKAACTLASLPERVKSGAEAKKLPGIGEKIAKKIDEFLKTGKLQKLEDIRKDESSQAIELLTRVSGIGPSKAKELVDAGIKTMEDLKKHQDKLNHHQKIGLKYLKDFETKIPREEIEQIGRIIKETISELDTDYIITICGSYRRGKEESNDIDILLTHPEYTSENKETKEKNSMLEGIINCLEKKHLITDTISLGATKFMGVCRLPNDNTKLFRRLDIRLTPFDQYYCSILSFTGNDLFNKNMRAHAQKKNYTLNEYSLRHLTPEGKPGEAEKITCEEDIFRILDLPYKDPKDRNS